MQASFLLPDATNDDGWGIGYFFSGTATYPLIWPIIRRGGPPANVDPDYPLAMTEVMQQGSHSIIAHVRAATSGHVGGPNPHPFTEPGWLFCHNGTIDSNTLVQLIGTTYLAQHPVDYTNPYIDSELFFVYLMKTIKEWPDPSNIEAAISYAVSTLDNALNQISYPSTLNFLLSNSKKMWGCRYADVSPDYYTLSYTWPLPGEHWVVASQPVSGGQWTPITMYHVMTFEPGMRLVDTEIPHRE